MSGQNVENLKLSLVRVDSGQVGVMSGQNRENVKPNLKPHTVRGGRGVYQKDSQ